MGVTAYARAVDAETYEAALKDPRGGVRLTAYGQSGVVDLDKAWDGILWLVSEDRRDGELADPGEVEARAILGYDNFDAPGEPYFGVPPAEVPAVASALDALTEEALRAYFDPEAMMSADVYPGIWDEGDESFDYLWDNFEALRKVYRTAAKSGAGVLVRIG